MQKRSCLPLQPVIMHRNTTMYFADCRGRQQFFLRNFIRSCLFQKICFVSLFPWNIDISTSEMAVSSYLTVDRSAEVEISDDSSRSEVEHLVYALYDL